LYVRTRDEARLARIGEISAWFALEGVLGRRSSDKTLAPWVFEFERSR
jgi:hypothetical protein